MRYLKTYKIFESTEHDLSDILLELQDMGYKVSHQGGAYMNKYVMIIGESKGGIYGNETSLELPWSELKEYALRIKDYLGDKYLSFAWRSFRHYGDINPYKTVELNENTEINDQVWSFVIKYKE
jgi:hypothetical protein